MSQLDIATLLVVLVCASASGCGLVALDRAGPPPGTLAGTVYYDGTLATEGRALSIAVYDRFPPTGPPVRTALLERYELPRTFVFEGLAPGTYFVGALLDVDRMDTRYSGMLNDRLDPYAYFAEGQPVVIDNLGGAAELDIRLEDPR